MTSFCEVISSQTIANNKKYTIWFWLPSQKAKTRQYFPVEIWEGYAEKRNSERLGMYQTEERFEDTYPKVICFVRDY